jgi:hypothetical protein
MVVGDDIRGDCDAEEPAGPDAGRRQRVVRLKAYL